ncbi:MAG: N-acetyl sugar amidotransferase [Lachnospiraceae bacterium]|nr:N-acetyl sugar amidotransferase [Lachnospiraceae bacterium]
MDSSSDDTIIFDTNGYCNYCNSALESKALRYFPDDTGTEKLAELLSLIKTENKNNEYDCLMGVSGGLDSSYLAYLGYKWGLRVICVHIDDGFDSDISRGNLEKLKQATGFKFINICPDQKQYNALIKAYMKAGVPKLDIPQDNILSATLFKYAEEKNIKYFLSGENYALECILERSNNHSTRDLVNLNDINRKFGKEPIDKLDFISHARKRVIENKIGIKTVTPLNFIDYNRDRAFAELADFCGFEYYGSKHLENNLTAFIQLYWLPKKFGVDKRKSHLSSMIISGQLTRDEALKLYLDVPLYDEKAMSRITSQVKEKLNLTDTGFDEIMLNRPRRHNEFKTDRKILFYHFNLKVRIKLGKIKRKLLQITK